MLIQTFKTLSRVKSLTARSLGMFFHNEESDTRADGYIIYFWAHHFHLPRLLFVIYNVMMDDLKLSAGAQNGSLTMT